MSLLSDHDFTCPYCGSINTIAPDGSEGSRYAVTVDCETCCRPIVVRVTRAGDTWELDVRAEND